MILQVPRAKLYNKKLFLYPGELHIAQHPTIVWTTLGSCVSLVLFSRELKIGGICHAQLPGEEYLDCLCTEACPVRCYSVTPQENRFRYVTHSVRYMLNQFAKLGANPSQTEVKLFGGSSTCGLEKSFRTVGERNIETALKMVEKYDLRIATKDVGGPAGRRIYFLSDTGEIYLNHIRGLQADFH